jgi:heptosyltransferase-1
LKALIIKTSSLGDVIHTLPAVTDAAAAVSGLRFDWVVEDAFVEIPGWHPAVDQVIPVALRRWRKGWRKAWSSGEMGEFRQTLSQNSYDLILDAQGLVKSAVLARMAGGNRVGLDRDSAREPLAALAYDHRLSIPRDMHAIDRVRLLFAKAFDYSLPGGEPDYGVSVAAEAGTGNRPYLLFLHGTTWPTKLWPAAYWIELTQLATAAGYSVRFPWGTAEEQQRAQAIVAAAGAGHLLPKLGLSGLVKALAGAAGVVGVDSGLAHLAAAISIPGVTLYGPTRTDLTGARGKKQINLQADFGCAPCMRRKCNYMEKSDLQPACFATLPPEQVWDQLLVQMQE